MTTGVGAIVGVGGVTIVGVGTAGSGVGGAIVEVAGSGVDGAIVRDIVDVGVMGSGVGDRAAVTVGWTRAVGLLVGVKVGTSVAGLIGGVLAVCTIALTVIAGREARLEKTNTAPRLSAASRRTTPATMTATRSGFPSGSALI